MKQYIRLFMGLLLALMICTPVFALVGKSSELLNRFQKYYGEEEQARMENEAEGIRKTFLREAYKKELEKQIRRLLSDAGIFSEEISGVEAEITAEKKLLVKINLKAAITESQKEAVKNGLERICGLEETQYQILDSGKWGGRSGESCCFWEFFFWWQDFRYPGKQIKLSRHKVQKKPDWKAAWRSFFPVWKEWEKWK